MRYHPHGRHIDTLAYYLNYLIMEKKSNGIAITKSFAKKMEGISPFELKNRLIDMADESVKRMAHNAKRRTWQPELDCYRTS